MTSSEARQLLGGARVENQLVVDADAEIHGGILRPRMQSNPSTCYVSLARYAQGGLGPCANQGALVRGNCIQDAPDERARRRIAFAVPPALPTRAPLRRPPPGSTSPPTTASSNSTRR